MRSINIISDYIDFYDNLSDNKSPITYKRNMCDCKQIGTALKYLRNIGIKTIDVKPVSSFNIFDGDIMVYTNPVKHSNDDKKIVSVEYAKTVYPTCVASKCLSSDNLITIKYLQIGKRRFTLTYKSNDESLNKRYLVDISESSTSYNMLIGLPIFSIDYIIDKGIMIATDFNEVENLKELGVEKIITAEEIVEEIRQSILTYNKL